MKILFVNEKAGFFGGVEQNIYDSALALEKRGHELFIAYGEECRDLKTMTSPFKSSTLCPELNGFLSKNIKSNELNYLINDLKPDAIYVHKLPSINLLKNFIGNIRIVRMVHDHNLCCPRRHKYFFFNNRICNKPVGIFCYIDLGFLKKDSESPIKVGFKSISSAKKEIYKNAEIDKLIVGSSYMKNELQINGINPSKIVVIPPTYALISNKPATPLPNTNTILFVGQLIKGKGVDILLHALTHVKEKFQLKIAGSGNAKEGLQKLAMELDLGENVEFLEWIPPDKIAELYQWARIVAVPSRWPEPFGMVGVEAMRSGRPVVATNSGGIPDWLHDNKNGLISEESNPKKLAANIDILLKDFDKCKKMGETGLQMTKKLFVPDECAKKLEYALKGDNL